MAAAEEGTSEGYQARLSSAVPTATNRLLSGAPLSNALRGDKVPLKKPSSKRPWLTYDPDALMPQPFDAFLQGGGCPRIAWTSVASMKERSKVSLDMSLYYVVGCRRSGMTAIAELMSHYAGVVFINEPRQLWIPLLPAMDVWSVAGPSRNGRLHFSPEDANTVDADEEQTVSRMAMDAYTNIAELASSPSTAADQTRRQAVVIEKFQEHAFRVPFLASICSKELGPNRCTFLHIVRDGVDVARSIAGLEDPGYGAKEEWKWKCLREIIAPPSDGRVGPLPHCCLDLSGRFLAFVDAPQDSEHRRFARGLAEWGASVLAARCGAEDAEDATCLEVRYEDIMENPVQSLAGLVSHLDLEPSAAARQNAKNTLVARPSKALNSTEREVLLTLSGSQVEKLLREWGRELPH